MALTRRAPLAFLALLCSATVHLPGTAGTTDLMTAAQRAWLVAAGKDANAGAGTFPPISGDQGTALFAAEEKFFE